MHVLATWQNPFARSFAVCYIDTFYPATGVDVAERLAASQEGLSSRELVSYYGLPHTSDFCHATVSSLTPRTIAHVVKWQLGDFLVPWGDNIPVTELSPCLCFFMGARARVTQSLGSDSLLEILCWNKMASEGLPREENITTSKRNCSRRSVSRPSNLLITLSRCFVNSGGSKLYLNI
jgi:hypothetical protein